MTPFLVGVTVAAYAGAMLVAISGNTVAHGIAFCVLLCVGAALSVVLGNRVRG